MKKHVIASWSGGKDSCFATYLIKEQGYKIGYLANTIAYDTNRVRFHGVTAALIAYQAECIGVPLSQIPTTPDGYREEFVHTVCRGITPDTFGVVFGDIHLADCYAWANSITKELGVTLLEPLWQKNQLEILTEFVHAGFEAVIVSTQADKLGEEWVGRIIDKTFITDIQKLSVDPCGENGEYHSFVTNGPMFQRKITITKSQKIQKNGYWFLDIQAYK